MRYLVAAAVVLAVGVVAVTDVPAAYVLGPLVGLAIARIGFATFGVLRGGPPVPDDGPEAVDLRTERITYWCEGCGTEVLLLVRGSDLAPRHCGERMHERREVARTERP